MKFIPFVFLTLILCACSTPEGLQKNLTVGPTPAPLTVRQISFETGSGINGPAQAVPVEGPLSMGAANQPSYEILQNNREPGPDGQPNRFFLTDDQARRLGRRKYTSGPCRNYYEGEEWWCK